MHRFEPGVPKQTGTDMLSFDTSSEQFPNPPDVHRIIEECDRTADLVRKICAEAADMRSRAQAATRFGDAAAVRARR